jgi:hypothetical protein
VTPAEQELDVVLFNNTFTNYNEPDISRAALQLPEDTGADVPLQSWTPANPGRRENARRNMSILAPLLNPARHSGMRTELAFNVEERISRIAANRAGTRRCVRMSPPGGVPWTDTSRCRQTARAAGEASPGFRR